jgi:hypothetical protein
MDGDFETSPMETPSSEGTLVEEAYYYVLTPEKETFFHMIHDPKTHYMEKVYSQNSPIIEDYNKSMYVSNVSPFTSNEFFQPWLPYDSRNLYYQTSQKFCQIFYRSQQVESPKNKNAVEGVKCDDCFMHILEDPFAILLEEVNNPGPSNFFRIGLIDKILNKSSAEGFLNKQVQKKRTMDRMLSWLH